MKCLWYVMLPFFAKKKKSRIFSCNIPIFLVFFQSATVSILNPERWSVCYCRAPQARVWLTEILMTKYYKSCYCLIRYYAVHQKHGLPLNNSWWNRKGPTYSDTTTPYERSFLLFFPTMQRKKSWSNYIKSSDLSSWQNSICFLCSPFASRITAAAAKKGSLRADLFTMAVSNSWFMHPGIALLQVTLEGLGSLVVVVTSFLSRWTKGESTARHSIDPLLLSSCLLCMGTSHLKVGKT